MSCENITDFKDLTEILKSQKKTQVIILDEISFVPQWERAIKYIIDQDAKKCFILTGSHAVDLRRGGDLLPGRFGAGREINLLPMDFFEFQKMRKMAKWPKLDYVQELELYFKVGGFPMALLESGPKGKAPIKSMQTYQKWLLGDLQKFGRQEVYLRELMLQIAKTASNPISLQSLAQKTNMGSHHTAQEYITLLEDCFALGTLYAFDESTGDYQFKKNKKVYFRDPLIYWIAYRWSKIEEPDAMIEHIAESVAYEEIRRKYTRIGYVQNKKGEVDFFYPGHWGIEVKWSEYPQNISKLYKELKVPEKIIWSKNNFIKEWPKL